MTARRGEHTDPRQLAFELYAPMELANFLSTLYRDPGLVRRGRDAVRSALAAAAPQAVTARAAKR
ncbi:MAG: hypothetical protein L0I24_24060 [Pseudonocardia sp.]|nr:hypothetical protein [Pseudonocardia sp.]